MNIDRTAGYSGKNLSTSKVREHCLGCEECSGICMAFLQFHCLPDIVVNRREDHA